MTGTSSPIRRFSVALAAMAAVAVTSAASSASADEPKCPPGSWFCADAEIKIGPPGTATPPPPPAAQPAPPPPVVIYTPAPPPPVYTPPPPPAYYPPPPPPPAHHPRPRSEIGLNLRLVGAAFSANDTYTKGDAGAGGIGASIRFRPTPRFALDVGLDVIGGVDANGYKRTETPLSLLGLLYLNPKSKAQVYLLGGFGFSSARVEINEPNGGSRNEQWSYFGAMFGGGLEFRVAKKVALNFDVRGFVRGRTDDKAQNNPEFTAKDGRTTNSSGGALFTGGLTFYF